MAALDWVQQYEYLKNGVYGDPNDPNSGAGKILASLTTNNPDYDKLYGTAIKDPSTLTSLTPDQATAPSWVDWSQLPKMGPPGYALPNNAMWRAVGGRSGFTPTPGAPTYNDPNYGTIQLAQQRAPNDLSMNLLRGLAIAAAAYPASAALGSSLGLGKLGTSALNLGFKEIPTLAQVHWSSIFGGQPQAPAQAATPAATAQPAGLTPVYNPSLYGNMGSLAAPPDGSAPVATAIAPNAYSNSVNTVVS